MAQDVGYEPSLESPILGRYSRETLLFSFRSSRVASQLLVPSEIFPHGFPFLGNAIVHQTQFLQHASLTRTAWDRPRMSPGALPGAFDAAMITMAHMREIASR